MTQDSLDLCNSAEFFFTNFRLKLTNNPKTESNYMKSKPYEDLNQDVSDTSYCLVSRIGHMGEEARDRAGQRQVSTAKEERARREDEPTLQPTLGARGDGLLNNCKKKTFSWKNIN